MAIFKNFNKRTVLLRTLISYKNPRNLEKLGSEYGGWVIPTNLLNENSICYCVGVGEDISFDLELIKRFSCKVFAFDPTPRSIKYIEREASNIRNYTFYPIGLWSSNKTMKFYAPKDPSHVSHSIVNLQDTDYYFEAECKSLLTIMQELGHSHLDLLKIDVEGAEHEVLGSIIKDKINITLLCVEFHKATPIMKVRATASKLIKWNYHLVRIDGWNFTFIRKDSKYFDN